jgi:hypothetical protein
MTGIFLQFSRVLPAEYPLTGEVSHHLAGELGFGRLLDFGAIMPRLPTVVRMVRARAPDAGTS